MKRVNGEGSIYYEESRKKWRCMVTAPGGSKTSKRFDSKQAANTWRLEMLAKYAKGTFVVKSDITLGEWIIQYLNVFSKPKVRAKTFNGYIDTANHISEEIASKQLQKVTPFDVQSFLNTIDASDYIREQVGKMIRRVSKKAYALGIIEKDFTTGVEIPHPRKKTVEVFTLAELQKIYELLGSNEMLRRHYLLIALAVASGCRMGELLALTPNDITDTSIVIRRALVESRSKLYFVPPKTEAGNRSITLPSIIIAALKHVACFRERDELIFKNKNGNPCRTSNIGASWKTILRLAGVPYRKFHCLRHTHATLLLAAGVPVNEVAKRLGHSRPSHTLNLYGHAIPGYDKNLPSLVTKIFQIGITEKERQQDVLALSAPDLPRFTMDVAPTLHPKDKFLAYVKKHKSPKN